MAKEPFPSSITYEEYLQLLGLLTLAGGHVKRLTEIEDAARAITGEPLDSSNHTGDAVWDDDSRDVDHLLEMLGIEVAGKP